MLVIVSSATSMSVLASHQGVITYPVGTQVQRIYAFAKGADGHLHVNYWDGSSWQWSDRGVPLGSPVLNTQPSAITYLAAGTQRIYAFIASANRLYTHYWDGSAWHWADQGTPPGSAVFGNFGDPGVVTYSDAGTQRIYAFVAGSTGTPSGRLFLNYWNGTSWQWRDQGLPPGTSVNSGTCVVTYPGASGQQIYAFVTGSNGHLYVNYWNGSSWQWADRGLPSSGANLLSPSGAITYLDSAGKQRIYAFAKGGDGHLYVNSWDGSAWHWADQGTPLGTTVDITDFNGGGTITYRDSAGTQRIYSFAKGNNSHLYVNYWDGSSWHWADQGTPPSTGVDSCSPGVITYQLGTQPQKTYTFVTGSNSHLDVNFWNGSSWTWADQGGIP
jgi:hypothetical protein